MSYDTVLHIPAAVAAQPGPASFAFFAASAAGSGGGGAPLAAAGGGGGGAPLAAAGGGGGGAAPVPFAAAAASGGGGGAPEADCLSVRMDEDGDKIDDESMCNIPAAAGGHGGGGGAAGQRVSPFTWKYDNVQNITYLQPPVGEGRLKRQLVESGARQQLRRYCQYGRSLVDAPKMNLPASGGGAAAGSAEACVAGASVAAISRKSGKCSLYPGAHQHRELTLRILSRSVCRASRSDTARQNHDAVSLRLVCSTVKTESTTPCDGDMGGDRAAHQKGAHKGL